MQIDTLFFFLRSIIHTPYSAQVVLVLSGIVRVAFSCVFFAFIYLYSLILITLYFTNNILLRFLQCSILFISITPLSFISSFITNIKSFGYFPAISFKIFFFSSFLLFFFYSTADYKTVYSSRYSFITNFFLFFKILFISLKTLFS